MLELWMKGPPEASILFGVRDTCQCACRAQLLCHWRTTLFIRWKFRLDWRQADRPRLQENIVWCFCPPARLPD